MNLIEAEDATALFLQAADTVVRSGTPVTPRGLRTQEIYGACLCLHQPRARLVAGIPGRVVNPAFAAAEAVWILSGSDEPWIYEYNSNLRKYADDGVLRGAYGPRLRRWGGSVDQLARVVETLRTDPDSRRAVIQLYNPAQDVNTNLDVPCTLGFRFHLRDGKLMMTTTMRSQDVWLGLPYDLFTFTIIQELMAGWLGVEVGDYHHQVDSLHLYEPDLARARELGALPEAHGRQMESLAIDWDEFDRALSAVLDGEKVGHPGWDAFSDVLRAYRLWRGGDIGEGRTVAAETGQVFAPALVDWFGELTARRGLASTTTVR